jgi:hypothetical protein
MMTERLGIARARHHVGAGQEGGDYKDSILHWEDS